GGGLSGQTGLFRGFAFGPLAGCGLGGFGRLTGRLTGRLLGRLLGAFPGEALGFGPGLGGQARLLGGFPLRMLTGFALRRE
ncbi:hypothetical protein, partial [Klebsiella pneumoniae]|uniref:hypothetical protein n=1 Tax=Klebsiella pneumoniae TaxID=573 RepID=UPI002731F198